MFVSLVWNLYLFLGCLHACYVTCLKSVHLRSMLAFCCKLAESSVAPTKRQSCRAVCVNVTEKLSTCPLSLALTLLFKSGVIDRYDGWSVISINLLLLLLAIGNMIRNALVRGFINQGFAAFEAYATKTLDGELLGKIRIVKTYGHLLTSHIPKIKSRCVRDTFMAGVYDIILSLLLYYYFVIYYLPLLLLLLLML